MPKTKTKSKTVTITEVHDENPFGALLEDVRSKKSPLVNLKSKEKPDSRKKNRLKFSGNAALYSSEQKVIARAVLRNISPGGLGFEINPVEIHKNDQVFVQFEAPKLGLGLIECTVQWVAYIEEAGNKMIGLSINKLTPSIQKTMESFFNFDISED